jgi:hypothetical protein
MKRARHVITAEMRTSRILYRTSRERVLTRTQIRHVRGTDELIARMVELGWLEPVANGASERRQQFALTPAGERAHYDRIANGLGATC